MASDARPLRTVDATDEDMSFKTDTSVPSLDSPAERTIGMSQRIHKAEDRCSFLTAQIGGEEVTLMMVADGHGGSATADRCSTVLHLIASSASDASGEELQSCFPGAFARMHSEACAADGTAGSTLTVIAINERRCQVTVANVGDSAALLVETETETVLTSEHRLADSAAERERVQAQGATLGHARTSGGVVGGPLRAFPGGLAVCRTIGDADCPAVSAVPDVQTVSFDPAAGGAIIVCSDGVWDALSSAKVAAIIRRCHTPAEAADRVVSKALKARGLRDDISAIVAWLGTPPWDATVYESRGQRLTRKLGFSFGSRTSPSSSPSSSPLASRHELCDELDEINELRLDDSSSLSSLFYSESEASGHYVAPACGLTGTVVMKVNVDQPNLV